MPPRTSITLVRDPADQRELRAVLADNGFRFDDADHAFWKARGQDCVAVFYRSGKLVLQGQGAEFWTAILDPLHEAPDVFGEALALHPDPPPAHWIGLDESGKGDYFGPLVISAARLARKDVPLMAELGVGDSKKISDGRIAELAVQLDAVVEHVEVVIGPEAYNKLYAKMNNVNRMLAWAHATALEELLEKAPAEYAVLDKFGPEHRVRSALKDQGRALKLDMMPRAEADPAVAAASILARNTFNRSIRSMSKKWGQTLPKGAGAPVLTAARSFIEKHGREALSKAAKLHFKTTTKVGGKAPL